MPVEGDCAPPPLSKEAGGLQERSADRFVTCLADSAEAEVMKCELTESNRAALPSCAAAPHAQPVGAGMPPSIVWFLSHN